MRKAPLVSVLTAAVLAVSTACGGGSGSSAGQGGTLRVGEINPFSGPQASGGNAVHQGYQLAIDEVNKAGGVMGKKVVLVKGDATTPAQGISEATRLVSAQKVDLFVGCYLSAVSNTASETAQRYNKLYWDTNAVAQSLTQRNLKNYIRSGPSAAQFGQRAVDVVKNLLPERLGKPLNATKVYISHEGSAYGTSIADVQRAGLTALGVDVTGNVSYDATSADLGSVIVQGQKAAPDVWVNTGYVPDISLLLRTAEQQNFRPKAIVLVGTGDNDESLKAIGAQQLQGVLAVAYPHTDMASSYAPGADTFVAAFKAKFGTPPAFPQSLSAYVGMKMLLDSLNAAKTTDPEKVRRTAAGVTKPAGSFANGFGQQFDQTYQNTKALLTVVQWQSGKTVTVYPKNAALPGAKLIGLG